VITSVKEITVARISFSYKLLRNSDGVLLAEGETGHAFANVNGKPINMKKYNSELFERMKKLLDNEGQDE